ncbi:GumC family protein [Reinekea marinisedimentorum]|uniref:non-specific protein-tyrosine kinase n=1 Tax=Reinekea marinisedimentorum TaxID=230495 RepID=A0A4R3HVQ9_9GAMM|nr:polysaccharide biosynthesis tyrosine autokinase [Reinekea marinisedimentorum]TCS37178.1 capsular exopolysaccharide synthesis family protein [Reinekea marinisedimentorum]
MNQPITDKTFRQPVAGNESFIRATPSEEVIDLSAYISLLIRNIWGIAAITLLCLLIGGYVAFSSTPVYRATATVKASPLESNASNTEQYLATALVLLFYETQYEIIGSRNVAEKVVDKLDLITLYKEKQAAQAAEEKSFVEQTIATVKTEIKALLGSVEETTEEKKEPTDDQLRVAIAKSIQANLNVSGGTQSQIINISYSNEDPELATEVVNAIAETYIQFGLDARLAEFRNTGSWLSDQYEELEQQLRDSEDRLTKYTAENGLVDTAQQERVVNSQLQTLNTELIRAQTQLSSIEEEYLAIQGADASDLYSISAVISNNSVQDRMQIQARQLQQVNELSERYGERHPTMIKAKSELASAIKNTDAEVAKVVENIEKNYRLAQVQVSNIKNLINEQQRNIQGLQDKNLTLVSLEREVENNRTVYENFQSSLLEANLRSEYTGSNVQILDSATTPDAPFAPNTKLIIALSGIIGLFIGIAIVFLRDALDNTFKTPSDIEDKLGVPSLGISPKVQKGKRNAPPQMQYLENMRSPFSENINTIRTGLQFSNIDSPPKTILVTSATGSEGKTTLSINLAAAFSQQGKTLLLELDLRKPSIAHYLKLKEKKGFTDLMLSTKPLEESITSTIGNLTILTCGSQPPSPQELISSEKFSKLLSTLSNQYSHIIIDAPPTLPVSDSCILANKVDGVILAVKANETAIKASKEAIDRLQSHNANIIGAVLSVVEPKKMSYYGSHYYAGEYYGNEATSS